MFLNAAFMRKENEFSLSPCIVSKVIKLEKSQYDYFKNHLLDEHQFLIDNRDLMGVDSQKVTHALLVFGEDRKDGYLVDAQGYNYARYSAHIPDARRLYNLERYASLEKYINNLVEVVDECADRVVRGQENGKYKISIPNLKKEFNMPSLDEELLIEMLGERPELEVAAYYDDEIQCTVNAEYAVSKEENNLTVYSPTDLKMMLARHFLWLNGDDNGQQLQLRNAYFEQVKFEDEDLCGAVIENCKFVNCNFYKVSMCHAEVCGTKFSGCMMMDVTAEETNFENAEFRNCIMQNGIYTHSNFYKAKFVQGDVLGMSLRNCCIDSTEFIETDLSKADMKNTSDNIEDWTNQEDIIGMQM